MKKLFTYLFMAAMSCQVSVAQNFGILLVEDFETGSLPVDWTRTQALGSDGWTFGWTGYSSSFWDIPASIDASQFAASNDDDCNCNMSDDQLNSPIMDLTNFDSVYFLFDRFYDGMWGSDAYFQISYDGGTTWLYLALTADGAWLEDGYSIPATITVGGIDYTFNDQMRFGFLHDDFDDWASGFAIDNVIIAGFNNPCDDIVTIPGCGAPQTVSLGGQGVLDFNFTSSCGYPVPGAEQLYSFTPTATGVHTLNVTSTTGLSYLDYMYKPASAGCDSLGWICLSDVDLPTSLSFNLTAGVEYLILVDNEFADTETQTFEIVCPCTYVSQGNAPESESCGADLNGGCNNDPNPPTYETIACGASLSGTLWADGGFRDTDWFELVVTEQTDIEVSFSGALPVNAILVDNCTDLNVLTSAGALACGNSSFAFAVAPGTYLLVMVPDVFEGYPCTGGANDYDMTVTYCNPPQVPANDLCDGAQPVTCGSTVTSSNVNATISAPSGCAFMGIGEGVWFSIQGDGSLMTASTCSQATTFDTEMAVFTGDCNNLVCVAGNDDDQNCGANSLYSTVTFPTINGQTYYIYVGSWYEAANVFGTFQLSVTCATPVANDECQGAESLSMGSICSPVGGSVAGASQSAPGCFGTADEDVWFSFVANAADATVDVASGTGFDAVFEVFSGNCGSLTSLACVDNTLDGELETTDVSGLTPGNTYYIRVYDWFAGVPSGTSFDICVYAMVTGIAEAQSTAISVYPNPSNGNFMVALNGVSDHADLTVTDVAGRIVHSQTLIGSGSLQAALDLDISAGTYLLQVVSGESTHITRIVVK